MLNGAKEDKLRKKNEGQNTNGKVWFPLSIYNTQVQSGTCAPIAQEFRDFTSSALCTFLGQKTRMPLPALQSDHPLSKNQKCFSIHNRAS